MNAPVHPQPEAAPDHDVVIIGAGFSGLGMAIKLKEAGREDFVILEKAGAIGGTWRDNTYPGCCCDVPSRLYSFSFEQKPDWSRIYSPSQEIWAYMRHCADKYGINPHVRTNAAVEAMRYDEAAGLWHVTIAGGETMTARVVVSGVGALHLPAVPHLPGIENFEGEVWHSSQWNHGYDLANSRVAVIGTGASAIQFVPAIQPEVAQLTLFQRTPPWVLPREDRAVTKFEKWLYKYFPFAMGLSRAGVYARMEARALAFNGSPKLMKKVEQFARAFLDETVPDPVLREKLTPDYLPGCKRLLISNDYYPSLSKPNVDVVTDGIAEVRAHSVVGRDGVERKVDAIIYGTGFKATEPFEEIDIRGRGGHVLKDDWAKGAEGYLGITVSGYPNMFMLLGPNTGLGHNSIIFMIEAQVHYILDALDMLDMAKAQAVDVKPEVQHAFNARIQDELRQTVWQSGCQSWYQTEDGRNTTIWPGFTFNYWRKTRHVNPDDYDLIREVPAALPVAAD